MMHNTRTACMRVNIVVKKIKQTIERATESERIVRKRKSIQLVLTKVNIKASWMKVLYKMQITKTPN
jgi:hypothetical protein